MKKIEVFYHFYIPPDIRASNWSWWVDYQLSAIRKSKLSDVSVVNMVITMPDEWTTFFGSWYTKNGKDYARFEVPDDERLNFGGKVREYINARYPFVNILEIRSTERNSNLYEGITLDILYKRCQVDDIHVLYMNNKGISGTTSSPATLNWLEALTYFFTERWAFCINKLDDYDMIGMKDGGASNEKVFSGNFWWARSEYIRKLPEPLDSTTYMQGYSEIGPGQKHYRYSFEHWPVAGQPNAYYFDTKTNHYNEYFFLEDYLKNNSLEY